MSSVGSRGPSTSLLGTVRSLAPGGDAVVQTERGLVFAPGGLPDEQVRLLHVERVGKVLRAKKTVVLEPSAERVEPPCSIAAQCGGCPWMHASAKLQSEAKLASVERALANLVAFPLEIVTRSSLSYRRRARLAFTVGPRVSALGFRGARGVRVVDADRCVVLTERLQDALTSLRREVLPLLQGQGEIHLAEGADGAVVRIQSEHAQRPELYAALASVVQSRTFDGCSLQVGPGAPAQFGSVVERSEDAEGRQLLGEGGGFSQAHAEINQVLGATVLEWAEGDGRRVLELFAGHGNLTLGLAHRAASVRAVERSAAAVAALRRNLAVHELLQRVEVIVGDAAASIPTRGIDVVVLDPPRTGALECMRPLAQLGAATIIYVSCDPATLGRDVRALAEHGYRIDRARAFDMFPQTAHVETVVRLVRQPR